MKKFTHSLLNLHNLNLVMDNIKLGVMANTTERIITVFNKQAEKITGYSKNEVLGRDCHDVFQGPFCGSKCSFCRDASQITNGTREYPVTLVTKTGETRHLEMTISCVLDHEGQTQGAVASFQDMTDSIRLSLKAEDLSNIAGIIGKDKAMQDIFRQIREVALYNYPVHVSGETGTGKERVAYAIHEISSCGNGSFVPVNCGAIPEGIVESELFGHVKGAFSGAVKERKGRFELAHKGTLFLDEVAELPLKTQVKLLRFLQEGSFEKVGGEKEITVDVRIISATNKDLAEEVRAGRFREDLYYRLNVIPVHLPPLRERKNDIPLLAEHFLREAEKENNNQVPKLVPDTIRQMMDHHWPGNVRELKNVIQFSVVRSRGNVILPSDLPFISNRQALRPAASNHSGTPLVRVSRGKLTEENVQSALVKTGGNKSKAAKVLGVGRATLYRFLREHPRIKALCDTF